MPKYNKLVRDRIPEIIAENGQTYHVKKLEEEDYLVELRRKAQEELNEYFESSKTNEAIEELADVLEVIYALGQVHGVEPAELEKIRRLKAERRGRFAKKLFLLDVEEGKA
ncbi:putative house-cleaning noncanonical NTP pyrophosphatase (MazG superfamily) [Pullulanibacillus pueri]|uniref:Phosphoribosyl-ATP pyrophosphohydrolase n=1 Tax=Pullulanibacillus pueri TaxID=1437324 RepID=A0A8J2ZRD1_9BACL|nr:nucleoside triphosphate pyrophosphohydrolase [Pullulanibacillus pueri]MBM7679950.1 putative house-cleaning noncanonical NTP pyrophosphatase (MazG superfamily) [Pullulanibacillus pueri]GGH73636.1 phosphoribosyl-ATP pyrophosphohydrolase [Pullulanibacillus pueri]